MSIRNFFTKAIVLLLVCLLIFMGIGNLLSNDDERKELAKVGKEVITSDEYKLLYQNYEKQISGSDVSKEQVKKLKYDLLNALIEQKLLFNLISELGLKVGEESIKSHIKNTKYFQDDKGEFDHNKFNQTLNSLHITEKEYIEKLEEILPAMMFMTSLFKDNYPVTFGESVDEQIYKNRYQTRVIDIVKITEDAITDVPEPDDQALLDLYEILSYIIYSGFIEFHFIKLFYYLFKSCFTFFKFSSCYFSFFFGRKYHIEYVSLIFKFLMFYYTINLFI